MSESLEHRHGGDPQGDFERFGVRPRPVIDFSANLSPLGPPEAVRRLWPDLLRRVEHYPSRTGEGVTSFFVQRFGLPREELLAGNGATELLYLLPRVLGLRTAAVLRPAYADYERACRLAGARVETLDLDRASGFSAPGRERLADALSRVDALYIGHPNNPTGTLFDVELLRQLAEAHPETWLVVDESFIQLTEDFPQNSLTFGPALPRNLITVCSLTKTYALAGLRLGALRADRSVIHRLARAKEPWTVNGVADRVALELLECRDYEDRLRDLLRTERARLFEGLRRIGAIEPLAPTANFLLARWTRGTLDRVLRELLRAGLCVRDCRNFVGLEDGYFRVAVRSTDETLALLEALTSLSGSRVRCEEPSEEGAQR